MGYCGSCGRNVEFEGGICPECGFDFDDDLMIAERTLDAVKKAKRNGWTIYPDIPEFGDPIDQVIEEYKQQVAELVKLKEGEN